MRSVRSAADPLSSHRRHPPLLDRVGTEAAERSAGHQVKLNSERVVDDGVDGEKALR
jgi:hypothetical protein